MAYTAEGNFTNEAEASADLAVCAYAGKWRKAKESVIHQGHVSETAYWDAVRLYFLELGGEWLKLSPVSKLPSEFQINDEVSVNYGYNQLLQYCQVDGVRFMDGKVLYDVAVEVRDSITGELRPSSYIVGVDSCFVKARIQAELSSLKSIDDETKQAEPDYYDPQFLMEVTRVTDFKGGMQVQFQGEHTDNYEIGRHQLTVGSTDKSAFDGMGPEDLVLVTLTRVKLLPTQSRESHFKSGR